MLAAQMREQLFLRKYATLKAGSLKYYQMLLQNERLSEDELEDVHWRRCRELLAYAYEKVPYYRRKFDQTGLHPNDVRRPEDFHRIPLLTRDDLRTHFQDLISKHAAKRHMHLVSTGGTTGQPVKVYHDRRVATAALGWRMLKWWGLSPAATAAVVWRPTANNWRQWLFNRAVAWPKHEIQCNAAAMDPDRIKRFLNDFTSLKPDVLHGYVESIDRLAAFIEETHWQVPPPRAVWTTAAPLTLVHRRHIKTAFGCPVYDQYGSSEVYWLAAQCPIGDGLHIFHDARKIECIDDDGCPCGEGKLGRIVVTDLENRVFPLIRYLNGDMGRHLGGRCPCGISLPLMDSVRGRSTDCLSFPSGQFISGSFLTTIFDDYPDAVRQFQICQRVDYGLTIFVVPEPCYGPLDGVFPSVERKIRTHSHLPSYIQIRFERTSRISQHGGKFRFVVRDLQ